MLRNKKIYCEDLAAENLMGRNSMRGKLISYLLGLFLLILAGAGALIAQPPPAVQMEVAPLPEPQEDVLMYWTDAVDDGPDFVWSEGGPAVRRLPGPHAGVRRGSFVGRGEAGPWLGVVLSDLSAEKAKELKLTGELGVLVKEVQEDSPAAKAGVLKDDVIVEFAGEKVRSAMQFRRLVRETPPDRSVTLVVQRAGQAKTLTATLVSRPPGPMPHPAVPVPPETFGMRVAPPMEARPFNVMIYRGARLGISGDDLTTQLAQFFGVKQGKGVLVREVIVGSAAEKAGLKAGDVIVAVDGKEVTSVGKLRRALAGEKDEAEKRKVSLTIVRDKREQALPVELDPPDRLGPKPFTRAELGVDPEEMRALAADIAAQTKEMEQQWRDQAQEFAEQQLEWQREQPHLQEE
jgi:membrane-associated protease RseP (regulator of RpoE activity)